MDKVYERIQQTVIKLFREMKIEDYPCGDEVIHEKQFLFRISMVIKDAK